MTKAITLNFHNFLQMSDLVGHEDAVQCLAFDRQGEFLVSGGSDLTVRIWS